MRGENWVLYGKRTGHHPAFLSFLYAAYPVNTYSAIQVMHLKIVYQKPSKFKNLRRLDFILTGFLGVFINMGFRSPGFAFLPFPLWDVKEPNNF
jgi:hypothetical protein